MQLLSTQIVNIGVEYNTHAVLAFKRIVNTICILRNNNIVLKMILQEIVKRRRVGVSIFIINTILQIPISKVYVKESVDNWNTV